ncbi:MAG: ATP-binding protein, partial [Oscillospiraceae bacterium]|nr:ATP-binding protein [Oscillospiraceae bacterium]
LAMQTVFQTGSDAKAAMEEVKQANLALQAEKKALIEANFGPGYLDETPICPKCGGSGYIGSYMCQCLRELCRQQQEKEVALLANDGQHFGAFRLDYYSDRPDPKTGISPRAIMARGYDICRDYAEHFSPASGNLLFNGGTGLGKTFLSACIAREVAAQGHSVAYETAAHLFSKLEKNRFHPDEETAERVKRLNECDLLIIDDLGTELPGQFVTAALYTLVNDRLLAGKPMVISTNLTIDELGQRYSPQIRSRLQGSFQLLPFVGQDIRVLLNRR